MMPPNEIKPKPPARFRGLRRWALMLAIPFVGTFAMLIALQRSLIYHPSRAAKLPAKDAGFSPQQAHDVEVTTEDQCQLRGWLVFADGHQAANAEELQAKLSAGRPLVLCFSGNAGNRSYRLDEIAVLTEAGADVLLCDFRGYGDSKGNPTEEGLARDARAVWKLATETLHVDPQRIVLFGESLGGGVAVRLASDLEKQKTSPGGIILRATFTSLPDAAAYHFPWIPVRWLLFDRFPNNTRIRSLTCPLLHFHGKRDQVVPLRLGEELFVSAPETSASGIPKRFVTLPNADHNDILETSRREVLLAIQQFFADVFGDAR